MPHLNKFFFFVFLAFIFHSPQVKGDESQHQKSFSKQLQEATTEAERDRLVASYFKECAISSDGMVVSIDRECFKKEAHSFTFGKSMAKGFQIFWDGLSVDERAASKESLVRLLKAKYPGFYDHSFSRFLYKNSDKPGVGELYSAWKNYGRLLDGVRYSGYEHTKGNNVLVHKEKELSFEEVFRLYDVSNSEKKIYASFVKNIAKDDLYFPLYKNMYELIANQKGEKFSSEVLLLALKPAWWDFPAVKEPNILWSPFEAENLIKKLKPYMAENEYERLLGYLYSEIARKIAVISRAKATEFLQNRLEELPLTIKLIERLQNNAPKENYNDPTKIKDSFTYNPALVELVRGPSEKEIKRLMALVSEGARGKSDLQFVSDWLDFKPQMAEKILLGVKENEYAKALLRYMRDKELLSKSALENIDDTPVYFRSFYARYGEESRYPNSCAMWRLDAARIVSSYTAFFGNVVIYPPSRCKMDAVKASEIPEVSMFLSFNQNYMRTNPDLFGCGFGGTTRNYYYASHGASKVLLDSVNPKQLYEPSLEGEEISKLIKDELKQVPVWAYFGYWNFQEYQKLYPLTLNAVRALALHYEKGLEMSPSEAKIAAFRALTDKYHQSSAFMQPQDPLHKLRKVILSGDINEMRDVLKSKKAELSIPVDAQLQRKLDAPIHVASVTAPDLIKDIIDYGVNVDHPTWFGKTPLMYAVQYSNLDSIKILLANGANINMKTSKFRDISSHQCGIRMSAAQRTPLMYAAWHSTPEITAYLLENGADKSMQDSLGLRAYDYVDANEGLTGKQRKKMKELLQ